jgi:hypothetical protein
MTAATEWSSPGWFPLAEEALPKCVCEGLPPRAVLGFTERHLQCVWADDRLRPEGLQTAEGEPLEVEFPGEWNKGPGPDFLGAVLKVGGGLRRIAGDVEIHIHPADWRRHGHASDSRYARVCAHVAYFPGALPDGELPPGTLQIALKPSLDHADGFSFDNIDLMAYPMAARAAPPPCRAAMLALSPEKRGRVLDAAGETRLSRRSQWLRMAMEDRGAAQTVYEETMAALGYRPNKIPMRRLARAVPMDRLRALSGGDVLKAYALLAGTAALLPDPTTAFRRGPQPDGESRKFIRRCWDEWWRLSGSCAPSSFTPADWVRTGIRPPNRPERRLMAAACLFAPAHGLPERLEALAKRPGGGTLDDLLALLSETDAPYWPHRLAYTSAPMPHPVALVGKTRVQAIAVNLFVPALAVLGARAADWPSLDALLPPETLNAVTRTMADRLFGPGHDTRLYRTALRRQGLLHLHHEHCLGDRSRCAECPFPSTLASAALP